MPTLLGRDTQTSANPDSVIANQAQACLAVATLPGRVDTIQYFETLIADAAITSVWLGIFLDDGSGLQPGSLLSQVQVVGRPAGNTWITGTGFGIRVTAGTLYWLVALPIGASGQINFEDATVSGGTPLAFSTSSTMTDLSSPTGGWISIPGFGPLAFYGSGAPLSVPPPITAGTYVSRR